MMDADASAALSKINSYYFENGPIRPPSEAYSLLIRATRNCPWNRCKFCPVFKGQKFELRSVEHILNDIQTAKAISESIKELGWKAGYGNKLREVAAYIYNQPGTNDCSRQVALWLYSGGGSAFLQDANSVIMRTSELVKVVFTLSQSFPSLKRITSYCRSKTAAKKSAAEFKELKEAGLSRIHVGMESGAGAVLDFMEKGMTAEDHVSGGRHIREAGIELSEYYMPGLGGKKWAGVHALESARILSEIDPDFIRLRTLHVHQIMPLWSELEAGEFELQSEDEIIRETAEFISNLVFTGELKSDHILNLLPELEGKFPGARDKCLETINRYLSMPLKDRLIFRLGRRAGYYDKLDDIYDGVKYQKIDEAMKRAGAETPEKVEELIQKLKQGFI